jgi:hypothetical protein
MEKLYICDPTKATSCNKRNCYINGGACYQTKDSSLAVAPTTDRLSGLIEQQRSLQQALGYDILAMTTEQRVEYIKEYAQHLDGEMFEMMRELPYFKSWKKYSESEEAQAWMLAKARSEWVDVLHFFLNITIALGFTPEELYVMFFMKNHVNYERQEDTANYKKCMEE